MPIQNITGPGYSHATFVVDSIDEVDQVPVKTLATTVLCLEDGQTRVADSQGGWHVFPTTSAPVFDNYTLLNNKPTLNGVTLNGDLTSSDVNVQDKLTAGSNIVISEDGTISAVGSGEGVVINATSSEMIKGHRVPKLTPNDVVLAYNALVSGGSCTITDEVSDTDVQNFSVTQADTFEGDAGQDICVMITYYDKMILTYKLESDAVTISSTDIGGSKIDYSTTEQDTGLKWVDGKTIYQKTVTGTVNISTTTAVNKIDDLQDAETIIKIDGTLSYITEGRTVYKLLNAPLDNPSYFFIAKFDSPATHRLNLATKFTEPYIATYYVTVQYTKTT